MLVSTATASKQKNRSAQHMCHMCESHRLRSMAHTPCWETPLLLRETREPCSTLTTAHSAAQRRSPPLTTAAHHHCSPLPPYRRSPPPLTTTTAHHHSPPLTTAHHRSPAPILNHPCVHKFNLIRAWGGEGRNARNHTGVARSSCQCVEHSQRRLLLRLSDYHARHASGGVDGQRAVLPPNQQVVWVVKERRGGCRLQRRQMARR